MPTGGQQQDPPPGAATMYQDVDEDLAETFVRTGCVVVRQAFDRSVAERFLAELWRTEGFDPNTAAPGVHILRTELSHYTTLYYTERLKAAIDVLVGAGRWEPAGFCHFHPVVIGDGSGAPFSIPTGWHVDGNWFHHTLHERRQALVVLPLWTDIDSGGGGTAVCPGSAASAARALHAAGEVGLTHQQLDAAVMAQVDRSTAVEMTGRAGDVVIMHAFLLHSGSANHRHQPRVISNTYVNLLDRPDFDRPTSPYEQVVHEALRCAPVAAPGP